MAPASILIVDDEPLNVDYLQQELEDTDYVTSAAADGQQALQRVQSNPPDLILLDLMMPVMDGYEALARLKADAATRDIPVIVISAANDVQNIVKAIELGAEDFLPKPFEPTILHARISSSLEKKRLRDLEQLYLKGLEREFDIARDIQKGFLPSELPRIDGWEIAVYFKAAREVAGDFYDTFVLPDGHVVCIVGDVCGKGVGAALFMTLFRSLFRALFTTKVLSAGSARAWTPAERLQQVVAFTSDYVAETHGETNMFATAFIGDFDCTNGTLTYVNCGNEAGLLRGSQARLDTLGPTGPVVGVLLNAHFGVKQINMEPNSVLLAFTDGIPDAFNSQNQQFGRERLAGLLKNGDRSPAALIQTIEAALGDFVGTADPFDDITMLAIRRQA